MSITNVITRITVDMAGDVKRFAVKAKQYDRATRVIVVSLLWDEVPYVLDSADTVRCNVHKPDGTIAIIEGDNIAVNGNTVTITLPGTALTAAGRAWADIEIETQDESQQVSCQCFEIDIAKSPVDDDSIISTNEFSAMKLATKAANDAAAAATAEIEATAAAGTAASQAAAAAQAATDAANQAAAAATASIQIDPTLTDNSKAAPAGMVGEIKEDLSENNSYNIFDAYGKYLGGTAQGATLTWDNNHVGTITRAAAASASTVLGNILGNVNEIPVPLVKGETYVLQSNITDDNIQLQLIEYRGSNTTSIFAGGLLKYTVPNDIDGIVFKLYVMKAFSGTATIRVKMLNAPTNKMLVDSIEGLSVVSDESIISSETINILKDVAFTPGWLNNTDGKIWASTEYQTSDFIPIDGNIVYVLKNVARYCAYDENKEYPSAVYGTDAQAAGFNGRSYLRVSVLNSNIYNAFICEGEKYYPNESEADSQPQNINVSGENFAPKMLSEIANADDNHFANGANLFDVNSGYIYVLGQAQVAFKEGVVDVGPSRFLPHLKRKYNGADIPTNGAIASTYFIPVQAGKYMFTNYGYWGSPAYDSDKKYVQTIPAHNNAYTGFLVPEGVSYVRLNFCAQTEITESKRLHSVEEVKNIMVWQEDEAVCTRPATTLQKQIDGSFVSPNYLDKVMPNMVDSDFLSAMKCMTVREINRREHAWRFGNFNAFVGAGTEGYYLIRKMLMDNGIDFCGFEEMGGRATDIGAYLKSWQFADGFVSPKNESGKGTNALSIVSRFEVQTWNTYTMTTVTSNKDCINARIRLPRYMDVYNPFRILSMYVIHPMVGANQQNLANELLSIIVNDESDYIVITSDTNSFADTEEGKVFWRVLEAGGFRPTIPITTKTVTQDNLSGASDAYPEKPWRHHSIDQIFISSNIDCVSYNVINTKDEYIGSVWNQTTTDGESALSDHDFVYADLVFKNEARQ